MPHAHAPSRETSYTVLAQVVALLNDIEAFQAAEAGEGQGFRV